jgi:PII-like signaling protein
MTNNKQSYQYKKINISVILPIVISMVEKGLDIAKALDRINVDRKTFYGRLTKEEKCLLKMTKMANSTPRSKYY